MKFYAETTRVRARQIAGDLLVLLWVLVWIEAGRLIQELVSRLAGPGAAMERAGDRISETMSDAASVVGRTPVVGDELRDPLDAAADAGTFLESAGNTQQQIANDLAIWLAVLTALAPIALLLLRYLPRRLRWIREASAADRLRIDAEDLHLFALRAIATQPLYELRRAEPDPAAALAARRYERLAALELESLGLKAAAARGPRC